MDLRCYIYHEYQAMSLLAAKPGYTSNGTRYLWKANAAQEKTRGMMSETEGSFLKIDARKGNKIHIRTWTNFVPL